MSIFSRFLPFRTRRNNPPVPADGAADKVADAAPDQDTHAADTAPAGPPTAARTGGRAGLAILLVLLAAVVTAWMTGPTRQVLVSAGLPDRGPPPVFLAGENRPSAPTPPAADSLVAIPPVSADSVALEPVIAPPIAAPVAAPSPDPELRARLSALETTLMDLRSAFADQPAISAEAAARLDEISTHVAELAVQIHAVQETATQALRTAREMASDAALETQSVEVINEDIRQDVRAVLSRISRIEERMTSQDGRIEALAGDIHLLARYGDGPDTPPAHPASQVTATPFMAQAAPGGTTQTPPSPPPELVQGRYRVGDWVGGYGVVTAIRKTPEGDHLVTPAGVVFAPAPAAAP